MWPIKKKTSIDYINSIINIAKKLKKRIEKADFKGSVKLLKMISKLEKSELKSIEKETGSKELMEKCIELIKISKEAISDFENGWDYQKVSKVVEELTGLEETIKTEVLDKTNNLDKYELGDLIGKGGVSSCYNVKGHPDLVIVLRGRKKSSSSNYLKFANNIFLMHRRVPKGVNFDRIIAIGEKRGIVAKVEKKAQGSPLHDISNKDHLVWSNRLDELAKAKQKHYDKLIWDMKVLWQCGLMVDPSKADNIFYDKDFGFTIIDLNVGRWIGPLLVPFIWSPNLWRFKNELSKKDAKNILMINDKLQRAGQVKGKGDQEEKIIELAKKVLAS